MRFRISTIALAVAAALPSLAAAVDFSYSGFSTAAYAQSDTDDAQVGYTGQPNGIDSDGTFAIDSKLGVQVTAKFNDMLSATVQGVAYADLTGDWEPHVDWAYVRFQPVSSVSLRAGYLRTPTFMYSDSVFVGYANIWVRPPMEVYNMSPVYQMRGVDATWRGNVGPFSVSVNPYYGDSEVDLDSGSIDVPHWAGIAASAEKGSFMTRIGYSRVELGSTTAALEPLVDGLRAVPTMFCANCAYVADRLDMDGTVVNTMDLGVQYDDGTNFVATEYAKSDSDDNYLVPTKIGAYLTYGRHVGSWMPYATYAISRRETPTTSPIITIPALAAGVDATMAGGYMDQDAYSVGVRYEVPSFSVLKAALIKLQFDHIDAKDGRGMLNNVTAGFDGNVNVVSASFDFIF
jgi:hypothetical protein